VTETVLDIAGLGKSFNGFQANADIDLAIAAGEIHAVIGPNGAGKTTFVNLIAGDLRADRGSIRLGGRDITHLPSFRRAGAGIGRVFQITSVMPSFTALANVAVAAQAASHSFRFWRRAAGDAALNARALAALTRVGLAHQAQALAQAMSHGEHRQLELAMAIVNKPRLLLLDEPTSGMGTAESRALIDVLRAVSQDTAVLLVEHDMDVVFSLADRITVLAQGRRIACGSADEVREDAEVQRVYLGEAAAEHA
jgi:branched-chain amino acid transport system ATP-binding protein